MFCYRIPPLVPRVPTNTCLESSIPKFKPHFIADFLFVQVLTDHGAAQSLLFQCNVVSHEKSVVLIGSCFSADMSEYHLISQINSVKRAMQIGQTLILLNCDNLYRSPTL